MKFNLAQLQGMRGQVALTVLLLAGAVVGACIPGFFRWKFEEWSSLGYESKTEQVAVLVATLSKPESEADAWTEEEVKWLFEGWLRDDDPQLERLILEASEANRMRMIKWAERGCVCGNPAQRMRSLQLLSRMDTGETGPTIERLYVWSKRRKLPEFFSEIDRFFVR